MRVPPHSPQSSALYGALIARPGHTGRRTLSLGQRQAWADAVAAWRNEIAAHDAGSYRRWGKHCNSVLTETQAHAIKHGSEPLRVVAQRYGISKTTAWEIRKGLTWKQV